MIILKRFSQSNERRSKIKAKSKKRELEPRNVSNEEKENINLDEIISLKGIGTSLVGGGIAGGIAGGLSGGLAGATAGAGGGYLGKKIGEKVYRKTKSPTASKIGATTGGAVLGGVTGTALGGPIVGATSAVAAGAGAYRNINSKLKRKEILKKLKRVNKAGKYYFPEHFEDVNRVKLDD